MNHKTSTPGTHNRFTHQWKRFKTEKTIGMHDRTSLPEVNHKSATMGRLLRVSSLITRAEIERHKKDRL
jgi:hypothetical protein